MGLESNESREVYCASTESWTCSQQMYFHTFHFFLEIYFYSLNVDKVIMAYYLYNIQNVFQLTSEIIVIIILFEF